LRQFVFCAFTCHPNGGISDFSIFIANAQKSIHFHLIIIIKCGREASGQSAAAERRITATTFNLF
jgi:hypothetical protein